HQYTARHTTTARPEGDQSELSQSWAGPDAPAIAGFSLVVACSYTVNWTNGDVAAETEIYDTFGGGSGPLATAPPGATMWTIVHGAEDICSGNLVPVSVELRHKLTTFGVADYSEIVVAGIELCDECSPV